MARHVPGIKACSLLLITRIPIQMLKRSDVSRHLLSSMEGCVSNYQWMSHIDMMKKYLGVPEEIQDGSVGRLVKVPNCGKFNSNVDVTSDLTKEIITIRDNPDTKRVSLLLIDFIFNSPNIYESCKTDNFYFINEVSSSVETSTVIYNVSLGNKSFILKCVEPYITGRGSYSQVITKTQQEVLCYDIINHSSDLKKFFVSKHAHGRIWIKYANGVCVSYEIVLLDKMSTYDLYLQSIVDYDYTDKIYKWFANAFNLLKSVHDSGYVHGKPTQKNIVWNDSSVTGNLKFIDVERMRAIGDDLFIGNMKKLIDINFLLFFSVQFFRSRKIIFDSKYTEDLARRIAYICNKSKTKAVGKNFLQYIVMWFNGWDWYINNEERYFNDKRDAYPGTVKFVESLDFDVVFRYLGNPRSLETVINYVALIYDNMIRKLQEATEEELNIPDDFPYILKAAPVAPVAAVDQPKANQESKSKVSTYVFRPRISRPRVNGYPRRVLPSRKPVDEPSSNPSNFEGGKPENASSSVIPAVAPGFGHFAFPTGLVTVNPAEVSNVAPSQVQPAQPQYQAAGQTGLVQPQHGQPFAWGQVQLPPPVVVSPAPQVPVPFIDGDDGFRYVLYSDGKYHQNGPTPRAVDQQHYRVQPQPQFIPNSQNHPAFAWGGQNQYTAVMPPPRFDFVQT